MQLLLLALLLSSARQLEAASEFACPAKFPCHCMRSEDKHKVHCTTSSTDGSAFDLTVQTSKLVRIQCVNSPDWSDFLLGANLGVGAVPDLHFVGCEMPGAQHGESVLGQLGIHGVENLKVERLRGNVSRADLEVFPQLKKLVLTGSAFGSVPVDLLYGLPKLAQLDLRSTQIKLPAIDFFSNSRSLVTLELDQNDLHEMQPGAFDGLAQLELLNMWNSNISSLETQVFRGLFNLVSLNVKNNHLRSLPNDIFHRLHNLQIVDLSFNSFTELPAKLFARNRGLRIVKLTHNRANMTRLPDEFFGNLDFLSNVSLASNGLLSVPENLFVRSGDIVELNLNRNHLTTLPLYLLKNARKLQKLSLNFNGLQKLPDGVFSSQGELVSLDLSGNHLTAVDKNLFHHLNALQELNMAHNNLKLIEANAFYFIRALRIANFSHNQLDLQTAVVGHFGRLSPFHECKALEELDLSHNNISEIFADWTVVHVELRKLDLSYNSFEYLLTEDLQFVSDNVQVDLTHNAISSIDLTRLEFISAEQTTSRDVVVDLNSNPIHCDCELYSLLRYTNGQMHAKALDFLNLRLQHLECDGPDYMRGKRLIDLEAAELKCKRYPCATNDVCECWLRPSDRTLILDCAERILTQPPATIVVGSADRVEIDLSGNLLRLAPSLMDNGYEMVRALNLSRNNIEHVNASLISPGLELLRLDGNRLRSIDENVLKKIVGNSSIRSLTLGENPWKCDCRNIGLLYFLKTSQRLLADDDDVRCALTNRSLSNLTPDDLCPYSISIVVVSSAIVFLSLFGIVTAALYFHYSRQIEV